MSHPIHRVRRVDGVGAALKTIVEQPMPGLGSEALDFRAASESFATIRKLAHRDLETLRLVTDRHGEKVRGSRLHRWR